MAIDFGQAFLNRYGLFKKVYPKVFTSLSNSLWLDPQLFFKVFLMSQEISKTYSLGNTELKLSTGKLANLAQGSVLIQLGGTTLLATTTVGKEDAEQDFFPLSVEYIEKLYARGAISGSKYKKREGQPSDEAIIKARQVDHSIRSLFPKSFRKPTLVVLTVLTYDQINDPEALAVFGASLSIMLTGMPYHGPSSSVIGCVDNDSIIINPNVENREKYMAEMLLSGTDTKMLNIEGWAKEVPEDTMDILLDKSLEEIKKLNDIQRDFVEAVKAQNPDKFVSALSNKEYSDLPVDQELIDYVKTESYNAISESVFTEERTDRFELARQIKAELSPKVSEKFKRLMPDGSSSAKYSAMDLDKAIDYIARKILRTKILQENKRRLGRSLNQIRSLSAAIDILPTVHGSALFERGITQSLSIVTLGAASSGLLIEDMEGESAKNFMHHYNMPPYTTGEAGRFQYNPGRREIGHGAIGENALKHLLPTTEEFPYTIRVVSEIMTSNGSTSMAATCASSMALMAAGVPLKEAVGGVSVGLVTEDNNEDNYKLLLDIEGIEDFYGDMDFKVTGTKNGVTAIQYENKLKGVKVSVLKEAFRLAKKGRDEILEVMNKAISFPRQEVAPTAPVVGKISIAPDQIGAFIGPGGKNIKELVSQAKENGKGDVNIEIEDSGTVTVTASDKTQFEFVKQSVEEMFGAPELGKEYRGMVDKIMPYGVFVNVNQMISGLCHISEVSDRKDNFDLAKVFEEGDIVNVKVVKLDGDRISFSIKGVAQDSSIQTKIDNIKNLPVVPFSANTNGGSRYNDRRRR